MWWSRCFGDGQTAAFRGCKAVTSANGGIFIATRGNLQLDMTVFAVIVCFVVVSTYRLRGLVTITVYHSDS